MRLTERPRSLADMRPGTNWPDVVQRVMDRALQRDVKARYASASEMGRDLAAALLAMPDASASDARTQPMAAHAVPPTRVAARDAATTVLSAAGAAPAGRNRSRMAPLIAAAGFVAILSAAGAAWTMSREGHGGSAGAAGVPPDSAAAIAGDTSTHAATAGTSALAASGDDPATPPAPDDTVRLRQPAATLPTAALPTGSVDRPARRRGAALRDREPGPAAVTLRLRGARRLIEANLQADQIDEPALRRAIAVLTRTLPDITAASDSIEARYLRAQALGLVGDTDRSCRELDAIASLELPRSLRTEIGALRASACQ